MSTLTLQNKNISTSTNQTKNVSPVSQFLKRGKDPVLNEMASFTFNSVVFQDGTKLKDVTFEQLSNAVWTLQTKN